MRLIVIVRLMVVVGLAGVLAACTSVKIVQRDGCWIRRTERKLGGVTEEIGPCRREEPKWVNDRLTRVVQECIAQADYRWQEQALAAWSRGQPIPDQPGHDTLARQCMSQGSTGIVAENENLKKRLGEVAADREQLRTGAKQDREQLRASAARLADHLGEAAKKPPGNAFASASSTSDGTASTESGSTLQARNATGSPPPVASGARRKGEVPARAQPRRPTGARAAKKPGRRPTVPSPTDARCVPPGGRLTAGVAQRPGAGTDPSCPPSTAPPDDHSRER